jgi:RNA polymerase-binding transcription factor DksA
LTCIKDTVRFGADYQPIKQEAPMSVHTSIAGRKAQLEQRLAELGHRLESIEETLTAPHTQDWEDMAIEREGDEVLDQMGVAGQRELRQITAALRRIKEGTFGECVTCGEEIDEARLDLLPATPFCRNCAPTAGHGAA